MVVGWVYLEFVMSALVEHPLYAGPCTRPGGVRVNKHHPAPTFRGAGPMESRGLPSMLASRWRTAQAPGQPEICFREVLFKVTGRVLWVRLPGSTLGRRVTGSFPGSGAGWRW